ncbi:hypothetical protein ACGFIG_17000 [Micromonospora sp. NPDC049048]|uniref:hypothetical protein n=1 Tax=Micromonospora sp. NPDC049048 TaxID=3364263 RepID=UPI0037104379
MATNDYLALINVSLGGAIAGVSALLTSYLSNRHDRAKFERERTLVDQTHRRERVGDVYLELLAFLRRQLESVEGPLDGRKPESVPMEQHARVEALTRIYGSAEVWRLLKMYYLVLGGLNGIDREDVDSRRAQYKKMEALVNAVATQIRIEMGTVPDGSSLRVKKRRRYRRQIDSWEAAT